MNGQTKGALLCQYIYRVNSRGVFWEDDPLEFPMPLFMVQLSVILFVTRIIYVLLKPLRQGILSAHLLAGIVLGPTLLGHNSFFLDKLFPLAGKLTLETIANIGFVLHLFVIGIQVDPFLLLRAGRRAVIIGCSSFGFPYIVGGLTFLLLRSATTLSQPLKVSLPFIIGLNSLSSFPVITNLLADLKILNSEVGHLASKTSIVSDACSLLLSQVMASASQIQGSKLTSAAFSSGALLAFLLVIVFVLRPLILLLTRSSREREFLNEAQFFWIMIIMFGCALGSELLGQHAAFGPLVLGVVLPDGPPIGATLAYRLDPLVSGMLLPLSFAVSGLKTNLFCFKQAEAPAIVELVIILGYIGKFVGTLVSALFCNVPFRFALSLSLIMCCKGIIEVSTYNRWRDRQILNTESFNLLIITTLVINGIFRPLVSLIYDPARKYMSEIRRTVCSHNQSNHLRILVCIHNAANVPAMLNLLEALYPTRLTPISFFLLQLMELKGRASAILVSTQQLQKIGVNALQAEQTCNAFQHFEQQYEGSVYGQHYTSIAPYASMHNDICSLAVDKMTRIVILPFHQLWTVDGTVGSSNPSIRNVNKNVINKAPCSVGILIDRARNIGDNRLIMMSKSLYHIAMLFFGGPNDWEALSFCMRMAEHANVRLTVLWFKEEGKEYGQEDDYDSQLMTELRSSAKMNERISCKDEVAQDGVDTIRVLRSLNGGFDLVVVGKHKGHESMLMSGLIEWSETPELGAVGGVLASSDFCFSALVIQQQPSEWSPQGSFKHV